MSLTLSAPVGFHRSPGNIVHCLQHKAPGSYYKPPRWSSSQMEASTHCNRLFNNNVSLNRVVHKDWSTSDGRMGRVQWQITHWISCLVSIEMRRADNGVTWMIWSNSTLPQKNDCWSDTKPGMSVSSTSSPFNVRTLKQQTARWSVSVCSRLHAQQSHISQVAHRVCPTNARTSVLSNLLDVAMRRAHIPLMPGRSMDACSWIPIPLRIILREPSLYAPITW